MPQFEWKANFHVEGNFPPSLPKTLSEGCQLEKYVNHGTALLSIRISRNNTPSEEEIAEERGRERKREIERVRKE